MNATSTTIAEQRSVLSRPARGRVGMFGLIAAEAAIFTIFVVAYLFYVGKSLDGTDAEGRSQRPDLLHDLFALQQSDDSPGRESSSPGQHPGFRCLVVRDHRVGCCFHIRDGHGVASTDLPRRIDDQHEPLRNNLLLAGWTARFSRRGRSYESLHSYGVDACWKREVRTR